MSVELGVVGDEEFCLGFRLVGITSVYEVEQGGDWEDALGKAMANPDVGILVMPSYAVPKLHPGLRSDIVSSVRPVVIPIGMVGESDLRDKIKQAVGVDLWAKDEARPGRKPK
jgi:V/A-type H+-transporting ATPase subunit F